MAAVSIMLVKKLADSHSCCSAASCSSGQLPFCNTCQAAAKAARAIVKWKHCEYPTGAGSHAVTRRVAASKFVHAASGLPSCSSSRVRRLSLRERYSSEVDWEPDMSVPRLSSASQRMGPDSAAWQAASRVQ